MTALYTILPSEIMSLECNEVFAFNAMWIPQILCLESSVYQLFGNCFSEMSRTILGPFTGASEAHLLAKEIGMGVGVKTFVLDMRKA